jgi:exonuclease VII small subunit
VSERIYYPIDEKAARLAHDMMSMRDYCEGSKTAAYRNYADRAYDLAERIAQERPKQAERAWRLAERYARKMAENLNAESRIGTRCPSILISGGGNFPVRKKEKQVAAFERNMAEFRELQGYISRLENILYGKEVIRSDEEDAIEQLEDKVEKLEAEQAQMKAVNAYYRKNKTLDGCPGLTDKARREIEGAWARGWYVGVPYPAYELSNNNANIKRNRERLETLKREKSRESAEQEVDFGGLDITVKENVEEMRIQLFFDGKPEPEIRDILKGEAFKWSPRNGCWQRQLTDNARSATRRVIEKLKKIQGGKDDEV